MLLDLRATAAVIGADGVVLKEEGSETVFWHPDPFENQSRRGARSLKRNIYRNVAFARGIAIFYE